MSKESSPDLPSISVHEPCYSFALLLQRLPHMLLTLLTRDLGDAARCCSVCLFTAQASTTASVSKSGHAQQDVAG